MDNEIKDISGELLQAKVLQYLLVYFSCFGNTLLTFPYFSALKERLWQNVNVRSEEKSML